MRCFGIVLSAGIEPALPAPQAGVLSVERRERITYAELVYEIDGFLSICYGQHKDV